MKLLDSILPQYPGSQRNKKNLLHVTMFSTL